MKYNLYKVIIGLWLGFASAVWADEVDLLVLYLNQLRSAQIFLKQTTSPPETSQAGSVRTKSNLAELIFQRPNLFRLEYKKPYPQVIVGNGSEISYYDIDLKQVTIHAQNQLTEGTPIELFLFGNNKALARHDFQNLAKNTDDNSPIFWIKFTPQDAKAKMFEPILAFSIDKNQKVKLLEINFRDSFGQKIALKFEKIIDNFPLTQQNFLLTYPSDVEIIRR